MKKEEYIDILKAAQYKQSEIAYLGALLLMLLDLKPEKYAQNANKIENGLMELAEDYYSAAEVFVSVLKELNEELFFAQDNVNDIYALVESEYGFDLEDYTISDKECFVISQNITNNDIPLEDLIGMGYVSKFHDVVNRYEELLSAKRKMMS